MALSNIFREPRRETTETAVGVAMVAGVCAVVIGAPVCISWAMPGLDFVDGVLLLCGLAASLMGLWLVALAAHSLGEVVCDALQRRGIHLRPRNRPAK